MPPSNASIGAILHTMENKLFETISRLFLSFSVNTNYISSREIFTHAVKIMMFNRLAEIKKHMRESYEVFQLLLSQKLFSLVYFFQGD